jgi:hypothetical protein
MVLIKDSATPSPVTVTVTVTSSSVFTDTPTHGFITQASRPNFLHSLVGHQQTTIRTAWRVGSRPIRWAESACDLHVAIAPLVVELQPKMFQISQAKNVAQTSDHYLLESNDTLGWIVDISGLGDTI